MGNILKHVTEADLISVTTRVENIERRFEAQAQENARQYTENAVKMGVFEANLKSFNEEARRSSAEQKKNIDDLKVSNENHANAIFIRLDLITNALGLDGTKDGNERLRDNLKYLNKTKSTKEETYRELGKAITVWGAKAAIVFILGAIALKLGLNIGPL